MALCMILRALFLYIFNQAKDLNIDVMVKELDIFQQTAVGVPIIQQDCLVEDTNITLPASKLDKQQRNCKGNVRERGLAFRDEANKATTKKKSAEFLYNTEEQISSALEKVFVGRGQVNLFDLGYVIPGVDEQFVSLPNSSVTYSYRRKNLQVGSLDKLLGKEWDVRFANGLTKFVTSVKFCVGKMEMLSGIVRIAKYPGESTVHVGRLLRDSSKVNH